jgi:hypothetical protein
MNTVRREIAFDQLGLGNILRSYQLSVPPNQRDYSWTDREVTQLFNDFGRAFNDREDYFLGTIVTIPRVSSTLEVVDGQQRLATTAILLAAIKDYLVTKGEPLLIESIRNEFLTGIDRRARERVPKLRLNIDDNDLFGRVINAQVPEDFSPTRPSHSLLLAAAAEARRHVAGIVSTVGPSDEANLLEQWVSFIQHRALAVLLRVPDDADAYRMFETLNDRGLRTSQADLIKNYLFGRAGERFTEVQARWLSMRAALESLGEEDITVTFLRHALIVQLGHIREAEVYSKVQATATAQHSAVTFANELDNLAAAYVATFNSEHERWNEYPPAARRAVQVLDLINIRPMRPLLLAVAAKMGRREATHSFSFLISLGVRLVIVGRTRSGSVEEKLADASRDVWGGGIGTVAALAEALIPITPGDREFQSAFEGARVSNQKLARYYLRSMETTARNEPEPWFIPQTDPTVVNLEHVLPKRTAGVTGWDHFTDEDVHLQAARIGNLALLRASDNSRFNSKSFEEKRNTYGRSPYVLTKQLAEVSAWTSVAIAERQERLALLAVETWPVTADKLFNRQ